MKIKLILPVVAAFMLFQLVPQAAFSQCAWHGGYGGYGGYGMSRAQEHHMWRAEHRAAAYGYNPYAANYGYGYNNYRPGLLGGFARAIF